MSAAKLAAKHSQIQRRKPHRADKGGRQHKNATGRNRGSVQKRNRRSAITSIEWDNRSGTDSDGSMLRELQSKGWSLEEALRRITRFHSKEDIADCCASEKLLAYTVDRDGAMMRIQLPDLKAMLRSEGREVEDLRFYPVLESPDVSAVIAGGLLTDVFKRYVLNDPEVLKLSVDAIRLQPDLVRVLEGCWQAFGTYEWPVNQGILEGHDPDEGKENWIARLSLRDTPREIRQFRAVLRSRFNSMLELMRSGKYRALGDPARRGDTQEILSSIWSHPDYILDMWDGDLLQSNDGSNPNDLNSRYFKRWRGVTLVRATPIADAGTLFRSVSTSPAVNSSVRSKSDRAVTMSNSRSACLRWLSSLMEASPKKRPRTKDEYWAEAQLKWGNSLSRRAFDGVWSEAAAATSAVAWLKPGRPKIPA